MSLELFAIYNLSKNKKPARSNNYKVTDGESTDDTGVDSQSLTIGLILYIIILILALVRVGRCSSISSDTRIFHYTFAIVSPTTYLILSFFPGACG